MSLLSFNVAEAVFEPFWDPQLSELARWRVDPGGEHGLDIEQVWCGMVFRWVRAPEDGPALRMARTYDELACAGYDRLIVNAMLPTGCVLHATVETDRGRRILVANPSLGETSEYELDLDGAQRIIAITLSLQGEEPGPQSGYLNWIGFADTRRLPVYEAYWAQMRQQGDWERYLKPASFAPSFTPAYGFWCSAEELRMVAANYARRSADTGRDPLRCVPTVDPEAFIREYAGQANFKRFSRPREWAQMPVADGLHAAFAGLLFKDRVLLRYAARTALSLAMCAVWDDGAMCYTPGAPFEQRSFAQSYIAYAIVQILDLAGDLFTNAGRDLLLRRLAEHGLGNMNFVAWKYDYIHHCNQLAAFSRGRIPAYLALEKHGWRVTPYVKLAMQELTASLEENVLPDGGFVEGSSYFGYTFVTAFAALHAFAGSRNQSLADVAPDCIRRTANYADAFMTTVEDDGSMIPVADAQSKGNELPIDVLAYLAASVPDSQWTTLYRRAMRDVAGMPVSPIPWLLEGAIPAQGPAPRPFVSLPDLGAMSSTRSYRGETVKLLILGNRAGAGHNHEDKGSFILEFAGDGFAIDPGGCNYSISGSDVVRHCQRHNMLVPYGAATRPAPRNPNPVDVKPVGEGDVVRFAASLDVTPGWEGWYRTWVRRWDSPTPEVLTIRDTYELVQGDGVDWYWNTHLPVRVEGHCFIVTGRRGRAVVTVPVDAEIILETLPVREDTQSRVTVRKAGRRGEMEITVRLEAVGL